MPQRIEIPGQGIVEFPDGMTDADITSAIQKLKPAQQETAAGAANAVGTGYWRQLTRLAGLPVDTVANVIDLGKAAVGAPYMAATGKPPPEWLEIGDRSKIIGSGENLLRGVRSVPGGSAMVDPANPAYEGGYLQNAGGALTGIVQPNSLGQLANQAVLSQAGAAAGKATYDATGSPALAALAGMAPAAGQQLAVTGIKSAVRGGEAGRRAMEQRVTDLRNAGIENPTLGLATGNQLIGGVENLLQSTPGAVGTMRTAREGALSGMEGAVNRAADLASRNRGAMESGRSIQAGARGMKEGFKEQQQALYNRLDDYIAGQAPVEVSNTKATLADLNAGIPGAPQLSKQFQNARLTAIEEAIKADTAGAPASVQVYAQPPRAGGGLMNAPIPQDPLLVGIPAGPARNTLPFEAVKKARTLVGNEIADNSLMSDVPRSKWNPLYGALSDDMRGAAATAGPDATNALNRAGNYTRAGIERMERIAPVVDRPAPEQSFTALGNSLKENTSTFQAVKKSLPEGARGDFAGTIIERLGKATPGQQDSTGSKWSPETFLTNWSKIKPEAQRELLSGIPNAAEVKDLVDSVARAASMMRENSRMWANPSGTSANVAARGVLGAVGAGGAGAAAGLVNPAIPIGAGIGLAGVNRLAKAVTNPAVRDSMMRRTELDPALVNSLFLSMQSAGSRQQPEQ